MKLDILIFVPWLQVIIAILHWDHLQVLNTAILEPYEEGHSLSRNDSTFSHYISNLAFSLSLDLFLSEIIWNGRPHNINLCLFLVESTSFTKWTISHLLKAMTS